jgi:hypothetical protein
MYDLAEFLPVTIKELKDINGFGKKKLKKYGPEILGIIRNYLQVNHLDKIAAELPEDEFEEKLKPGKGQSQRVSLEMFLQGKTISEIALERSYAVSTIEGHLARFVASGELDSLKVIPAEKLTLISAFFIETGSTSLSEAKEILGDKVTYGELRLVMNHMTLRKS